MKKSTKSIALLTSLVLITSCFVGGTIARYITSTSSEDTARVAVWGINDDGVTMDLFNNTYELSDGTIVAQSNDRDKIIAPGTHNDSKFSIVNTDDTLAPEVMYEITIDVDDSKIDPLILSNPGIQWRLDGGAYGTWEETKAKILALSGDPSGTKVYAPGDMEHEFANSKIHTIGWQWLLDSGNDELDTQMGNEAATRDITAKISIRITAIQSDGDTDNTPKVSPLANTSWKFNNTITDFSIFDIFDYENQTGWEYLPNNTVIENNESAYVVSGLSMTEFSGLEIFTTVFHEYPEYCFYYVEENSLGLPTGWVIAPRTLVDSILNGGSEAEIQAALAEVRSTEAPTISFPTASSEAVENDDFIDWLKENATQVD